MARPRRGTEEVFYDTFADWELQDQAAALRVLEAVHRQKQREQRRLPEPEKQTEERGDPAVDPDYMPGTEPERA